MIFLCISPFMHKEKGDCFNPLYIHGELTSPDKYVINKIVKTTYKEEQKMYEHNNENKNIPEQKNVVSFRLSTTTLKRLLIIITYTFVLYWGINHFDIITSTMQKIMSVLSPFLIGFCLAFIINVLMRPMESLWDKALHAKSFKKIYPFKRAVCLITSTVLVFGIVFAALFMIIPEFRITLTTFIDTLPNNIRNTQTWINDIIDSLKQHGIQMPHIEINMDETGAALKQYISEYGSNFVDKTMQLTTSIFGALFNLFLSFVLSLYMLAQKEQLGRQFKKFLYAKFKKATADKLIQLVHTSDKTFTSFVTGQLTEAVIIGVLCFVGMLILRIPYASVISTLVGITALVPVFGAFMGTAIGALLILLTSPMKALWFIIFIIILQQLEGNLIYPRVVGKSVGLPGIWVLTAVTIGGGLFGFFGMLICVPVASIIYTYTRKHINEELKEKGIEIE